MICTSILMEEHQVILRRLVQLAGTLEEPLASNTEEVLGAIQFIKDYADKYHHAKEEDIYFVWMLSKEPRLGEGGPIACMHKEHERGRKLVEGARLDLEAFQNGDTSKEEIVKAQLREFIQMLNDHISKEDNILYQMAEELNERFKDGDHTMLGDFQKVNKELEAIEQSAKAYEARLAEKLKQDDSLFARPPGAE